MLSAAAPLALELIQTLHQKLNFSVRQAYGMSECAPCTHMQVGIECQAITGPRLMIVLDLERDTQPPGLRWSSSPEYDCQVCPG